MALAQGVAMFSGIWPLVAPLFGSKAQQASNVATSVVNDLTQIAQIVTSVEAVIQTPGSGAVKLAAATPLVLNILKTSEAFSGHKIADEQKAIDGATQIVNGVVAFMNALAPDGVQTAGKVDTSTPAPTV
jgi:hypothetical protein